MRQERTQEQIKNQEEEIALLSAIANGNRDRFGELHSRFAGVVYATIYKVLNDAQDSEDVAQEVFSSIWRKAKLYSPEKGKPLTWVTTMARNRAIDKLRSKQRQMRLADDYKVEQDVADSRSRIDSMEQAENNDRRRVVRSAVLELSKEQREAIQMAYFRGLTQSEIADRLGQPLGTVKARIRRGMIKLRSSVPKRL